MAGLVTTYGAGAMTNSIPEIREADFLFVTGSNTTEAHPIIAMEMKRAVRRGAQLAVGDPRAIWLTEIADWSKMKYKRFIDAAGGWEPFQGLLEALAAVARRHGVSVSNVAVRWVLDRPGVAAAIVGSTSSALTS